MSSYRSRNKETGMSERHKHYALVAILLHWIMAAGIVFMIWLGWNMDQNESLYQLHKSIGITLLMLTVARLIWRLMNPPPPLPDEMSSAEKTASQLVHAGFYVLMLAMPLTGWALVSTSYQLAGPTRPVIFDQSVRSCRDHLWSQQAGLAGDWLVSATYWRRSET